MTVSAVALLETTIRLSTYPKRFVELNHYSVCVQANKRIYMYPNRNNPPAHPCNYGLTITGNVNTTNQLSEKHGINKLLQARNKDRKSESIFFKPSRSKKAIF